MKKLLYSVFLVGLFFCSINAKVSAQDSKKQEDDFKVFIRDFGSTKVRLSDDGKVLVFADPSVVLPVISSVTLGLLTGVGFSQLVNIAYRECVKNKKNAALILLIPTGLGLAFTIYATLDLMKKIERKNKKTAWLTLDNNQIAIDDDGTVSFLNWCDIADTYWETVTRNGITCRSLVEFRNKKDVTLRTLDGMYLPIEPKEFCKLIDYYLSIQD